MEAIIAMTASGRPLVGDRVHAPDATDRAIGMAT